MYLSEDISNRDHIRVKIHGGIGNQMYQYAMARTLADKLSLGLTLDISFYHGNKGDAIDRTFSLDKFNIRYDALEEISSKKYWCIAIARRSGYLQNKFDIVFEDNIRTPTLCHPDIREKLLVGYWQNYHYFQDNSENILADFSIKKPLGKASQILLSNISQRPSVMLHIRRGDYVTSSESGGQHCLIPISYYKKTLDMFPQIMASSRLFIFSDDIEWCKKLDIFEGYDTYFVGQSVHREDYEDLP